MLLFTGIPVLPELAIGFGLVRLGSLLASSRIRRNRSAGRA
jgi:hypothetical protein